MLNRHMYGSHSEKHLTNLYPTWDDYPVPNNLPAPTINDPALPLVSIVTPSYNQGRFIGETIESVLGQDYPNLEYWVIDGGSTDETLDVLRQHEADARLHWISEPDKGQSDAINKGLVRCRGEIVGWLNSDDRLLPGAVRRAANYLCAHPETDLITGDVEYIDSNDHLIRKVPGQAFNLKQKVTDLLAIHQPGQFVRQETVKAVGPLHTNLHYTMDLDWWLRMALNDGQLTYVPGECAQLRIHPNTKMTAAKSKFWEEYPQVLDLFFAHPNLPPEYLGWRKLAYSNAAIHHGVKLLQAGKRKQAAARMLHGIWLAPWRTRTVYALLLLVDAYTGLNTWEWVNTWRHHPLDHSRREHRG